MEDRGPRTGARTGRRTAGFAAGSVVALVLAWAGCTVTQENYDLLTFFFDGVPDPNAPMLPGASLEDIRRSPTYSIHQPFAEDRCAECHERRFDLGPADSGICLKCHEGVPTEQPRMHGPVAAAACLWCHTAHESPYAALMKGSARDVCMSCHDVNLLSAEEVPEHAPEAEQSCLDCHAAHGGTNRYFLHSPPSRATAPTGARSAQAPPPGERERQP